MGSYGERYLKADEFVSYCASLNVETTVDELEHYERTGIMLPVARVIYPEDYIIQTTLGSLGIRSDPLDLDQWPGVVRLSDRPPIRPQDYADLPDEELIDSFDREMDKNPYLVRPTPDNYRPWNAYTISVPCSEGQTTQKSIAEHYYGYWQIHQLYFIQKYPDLYANRHLLAHISDEIKERLWLPRVMNSEVYREFKGKFRFFDALSFWITVWTRENRRTFALIPEEHQVRNLDEAQLQAYRNRLATEGKMVLERFNLTIDDLYQFLYELVVLYGDYQRSERFKLSDDLRSDIIYLARLIGSITGLEWDAIGEELGQHYTYSAKQTFRHLDLLSKEYDEAIEIFSVYVEQYDDVLARLGISSQVHSFSDNEITKLLEYCVHEGFVVLPTALSGMTASSDEVATKFRNVTRYTNLKNTLTGFEYLLKGLAEKGGIPLSQPTLTPIVTDTMKGETWFPLFIARVNARLTRAETVNQFASNFAQILSDTNLSESEDAFWARVFVLACLARNGTVHNYVNQDWFYAEAFGEMVRAAIYAILYSWQVANREGWV